MRTTGDERHLARIFEASGNPHQKLLLISTHSLGPLLRQCQNLVSARESDAFRRSRAEEVERAIRQSIIFSGGADGILDSKEVKGSESQRWLSNTFGALDRAEVVDLAALVRTHNSNAQVCGCVQESWTITYNLLTSPSQSLCCEQCLARVLTWDFVVTWAFGSHLSVVLPE